jgi:FHS family glucose/mannose:H+ symporter-like MFS transporter
MAQQQRHDPDQGVHVAPPSGSPHLALLHGGMLLSGFGTVFLGPALPALAASAHASDGGSGLFFTAQFIGAFFGGVTTSRRLWRSLIRGSAAATIGFFLLALCVRRQAPAIWDAAALLPLGFGVGQMLTSLNLLASRRFAAHRGAALSLVNFSWSLGAVLAPFVLGTLLLSHSLHTLLLCVAALFALALGTALWNGRGSAFSDGSASEAVAFGGLPTKSYVYFASLLLLYGGVETSLSGWITTFGTRYGSGALQASTLGATALWIGITAGRALSSVVLRAVRERTLLIGALTSAAVLTAALSQAHGSLAIIALSALLGLSLAPWFPLVLSAMLGEGAVASQVGLIIAVSGLGAAALPLLVGQISRVSGSLRIALLVPLFGLIALLFLSFRRSKQPSETAAAGV